MKLRAIRKHSGIIFYGYTFGTVTVYWSMKLYEGCESVRLTELLHKNRYVTTNFMEIV